LACLDRTESDLPKRTTFPLNGITIVGDVPALGQHTDAILEELDVARDTIAAWRKEGAI
jgi:crotonobetainyl-CoA:carnitine CoA-transferase CaiB-like acyl-CoA transferase